MKDAKKMPPISKIREQVTKDLLVLDVCTRHWRKMIDEEKEPSKKREYRRKWEKYKDELLAYETMLVREYGLVLDEILETGKDRNDTANGSAPLHAIKKRPAARKGRPKGSLKWHAGVLKGAELPEGNGNKRLWVDENSVVHAIIDKREELFAITSQKAGNAFADLFVQCKRNFNYKMLYWGLYFDDNVRKMLDRKGAFKRGLLVKLSASTARRYGIKNKTRDAGLQHFIMINSQIFRGLPGGLRNPALFDVDLQETSRDGKSAEIVRPD